jgi:hypothetical protein
MSNLYMMIATHALAMHVILVRSDKILAQLKDLFRLDSWRYRSAQIIEY